MWLLCTDTPWCGREQGTPLKCREKIRCFSLLAFLLWCSWQQLGAEPLLCPALGLGFQCKVMLTSVLNVIVGTGLKESFVLASLHRTKGKEAPKTIFGEVNWMEIRQPWKNTTHFNSKVKELWEMESLLLWKHLQSSCSPFLHEILSRGCWLGPLRGLGSHMRVVAGTAVGPEGFSLISLLFTSVMMLPPC